MAAKEGRVKRIEEYRVKAFTLSSKDKIGNVVQKALESLLVLAKNSDNVEELDFVAKSLESERTLIKGWDKSRNDPVRDSLYDVCESIEMALRCMIDKKMTEREQDTQSFDLKIEIFPEDSVELMDEKEREGSNVETPAEEHFEDRKVFEPARNDEPLDLCDVSDLESSQPQPDIPSTSAQLSSYQNHAHLEGCSGMEPAEASAIDNPHDVTVTTPRRTKGKATLGFPKRIYKCEDCDMTFKTQPSLKRHIDISNGNYPFECHECNAGFTAKPQYVRHIESHRNGTFKKVKPRVQTCSLCQQNFLNDCELAKHLKTHGLYGEDVFQFPFICDRCEDCFEYNSHLNWHKKNKHPESIQRDGSEYIARSSMRVDEPSANVDQELDVGEEVE